MLRQATAKATLQCPPHLPTVFAFMVRIPTFSMLDAAVGLILLMGLLGGLKRGLSGEISRTFAFLVAGVAGWKLAGPGTDWAVKQFHFDAEWGLLFAFLLVALLALLALWLLRRMMRDVMHLAFKGRLEKIGGAVCGLARAAAIAALLLLALCVVPQADVQAWATKRSYFGGLAARHLRPAYDELRLRHPGLGLPDATPPADADLGETAAPVESGTPVEPAPEQ